MSVLEIGCCGAYCKTCRVFRTGVCKGCKTGYANGERDIARAKCKIKVCCLSEGLQTCADCAKYGECAVIRAFHRHEGYKYAKYRQAIAFIRANGYPAFLALADGWTNACGAYGPDGGKSD